METLPMEIAEPEVPEPTPDPAKCGESMHEGEDPAKCEESMHEEDDPAKCEESMHEEDDLDKVTL